MINARERTDGNLTECCMSRYLRISLLIRSRLVPAAALAALLGAVVALASAETIDPVSDGSRYAWGENVGWISAEPLGEAGPGVTVSGTMLAGWMYGENLGWINMHCENNASCADVDFGVTNDGTGSLAGYAWAENVGWISFSCANTSSCGTTDYGVTIDPATGVFSGNAWGENIGWISFSDDSPVAYAIVTDDGDGIAGSIDNCPFDANPAQVNTDAGNAAMGFPGADALGDVCDDDDDGDHCLDVQEEALDPAFGGDRDPLDPWDFFEVTGDRRIDLNDTLFILQHFGHGANDDALDNRLDRYVPPGNEIYQTAESTGGNGIDLDDALANLGSFGHDCS